MLKYKVYLIIVSIGTVAASFSWLLDPFSESASTFDRVTYPLMTVFCATLTAALWWKKEQALQFVGLVGIAGGAAFLLAKAYYVFHAGYGRFGALGELSEVYPWTPVVLFAAFSVFGIRGGLVGAGLFYVAFLVVTLPHVVPGLLVGEDVDEFHVLVQLYLSSAVIMALFFVFARVTGAYAGAQARTEMMETLARTDALTGTYNRRHLYEALKKEGEKALRYGRPLSLIMLDLDYFKRVNDTYGHDVGDRLLKEVAQLIGHHLRDPDQLSRWGGEEFLVLVPETVLEQAQQLAVRLKCAIETHQFEKAGGVTASFGVAAHQKGDTPETLLKRADRALYQAKSNGRNRVEVVA